MLTASEYLAYAEYFQHAAVVIAIATAICFWVEYLGMDAETP